MNYISNIYQYLSLSNPKVFGILTIIGALVVLSKVLKALRSFYRVVLRPSKNLLKRYGQNSWVLITGSSDGIGKQFALSFAKRGFNIIISARTRSKLQKVADEIKHINPKSQVKIIATDFTNSTQQGFMDEFMRQIQDLDISVLVNNVGMEFLSPFHQAKQKQIKDVVIVNTIPISLFANRLIQRFLKRNKRSAMINLSSCASQFPFAGYHVYTASKAFDDLLSRSLAFEYPQIDILSVLPNEVSTPMTSNKETDFLTLTGEQCVEGALIDLGWQRQTSGHIRHKILSWLFGFFSQETVMRVWKKYVLPSFYAERERIARASKKAQ